MLWSATTFCQEQSLTSFIHEIESNSSYIVNYDKAQTDDRIIDFSFNGDFSRENIDKFFALCPFECEIEGQLIVLRPLDSGVKMLCGTVKSEEGEALPFASIVIDSTLIFEAEEDGSFGMKYRGDAANQCVISYIGYKDLIVPIESLLDCSDIYLQKDDLLFSESIIIRGYIKRSISEGRSYGSLDMNLSSHGGEFVSNEQDVYRSLQNLPGISSPDDGATNLNIRGGTADHNNITWEGVPLYDRGYLSGMISSVNPFSIKDVHIYKSNTSAEKNSRIGGTVDMTLSDEMKEKTTTSAGINLTEGHLNLGAPLIRNRLGLFVAGRKSLFSEFQSSPTLSSYAKKIFQTNIVEVETEDESSEESEPKISFHDLNAKLIYDINDRLKIRSAFMSSKGENENLSSLRSVNLTGRDIASTSSNALMNHLEYDLSRDNMLSITHTFSTFESENELLFSNDSSATTIQKEETSNRIEDNQLKLKWTHQGTNWNSSLGYIYDQKSTTYKTERQSTIGPEIENELEAEGDFHHLFVDQQWKNDSSILDYGLRASYSSSLSQFYLSPSFNYRYQLGSNIILKSGAGIYHQFIRQVYNTVDDGLNDDNTIWTLNQGSNEPVLRAQKVTAGSSWRNSSWLIDVEAYYHKTNGLLAENPIIRNTVTLNSSNRLFSKGIDFIINKKIKDWSASIFYSLSENKISLPEVYEDENESFFANNNQTHKLNINGSYEFKRMEFGLSYHFKTGLPFSGSGQVESSDSDEEKYELQYENINDQILNDYHRLDVSVRLDGSWKQINYQLGCSILNVLDRTNVGSRKTILTNAQGGSSLPTIVEIKKNLLPRTFILYTRLYF